METGTTGAANELNVCFASEPETMDPSMNRTVDGNVMITHLFEGLYKWVDSDPSGDGRNGATAVLEPGMAAEEPTVTPNEDGTYTYTFKLREDAKWSDGQPVTANDFVYSWRRLVDPATASPYNTIIAMVKNANEIIAGELPKEELGVAAPDEHTFEVTLTYNCPYFLDICAFPNCMPLREDIVEGNATWTQDPSTYVTNGAFKMASWTHDAEIVMVPNENYYDASSITLEKLTFKLMDDANAQLTAFKAGEIAADAWVPVSVVDAEGTSGDDFRTVGGSYWSVSKDDYEANCEEARKLLAEAGYENGVGFPETTYLYNTDDKHQAVAEALQSMWKNVLGVEVTLNNQDWNVFLETRSKGDYSICRNGWIADYNDPVSFLDMFMTDNGNNDAHYSNAEYDAIMTKVLSDSDAAGRMELMHQAEDLLVGEDQAIAPLYYYSQPYMVADDVHGMYYTPLGNFLFFHATKG